MLTILKRERAIRWLPVSCALALLLTLVLLPVIDIFSAEPISGPGGRNSNRSALDSQSVAGLLLMITLQTAFVSLRHLPIQSRVQDFERVLPISMRRIVIERMAATWLALAVPACLASLVWATRVGSEDLDALGIATVRVLGGIALGAATVFAYRPRRPHLHWIEVVGLAVTAIFFTLWGAITPHPPSIIAVPLLILGLVAYLCTTLTPGVPADDPRITSPATERASPPLPVRLFGPLRWTLLRSTFLRPPILFLSIVGGVFIAAAGNESALLILWFPALIVDGAIRFGLNLMHGVDALPMRRARLLPYIALPTLAILAVSFMAWGAFPRDYQKVEQLSRGVKIASVREKTLAGHGEREIHVQVPPDLWQIATSPEAARITAPWGETFDPVPHPVFYGAPTFAYCPYDVGPTSSVRFYVWQVSRAIRAVDADDPDTDRELERFEAVTLKRHDPGQSMADAKAAGLKSLSPDFDRSTAVRVPNAHGFLALCAVLLWFVIATFSLRPNVPSRSGALWLRVLKSQAAGGVALFALILLTLSVHRDDRALLAVLGAKAHQAVDVALGSSPYLWTALVLALVGAGYAFLAWRIQRIEVPPLAVNGWTKKAMAIY